MAEQPAQAAFVTGASSGIGLAIARMLVEQGYGVTLMARRPEPLREAAASLGELAHAVPGNVGELEDIARVVDEHRSRFGRLDVLVANAGFGGPSGPVEELEPRRLQRILDVNLRGTIALVQAALPLLREAGAEHGRALVVTTSSTAGGRGQGFIAAYSASKAGMIGFGQALQQEVGDAGIKVTTLVPAVVDTPMSDWIDIPRDEMLRPEDLAEAVRFLLRLSPACAVPELQMLRPGLVRY